MTWLRRACCCWTVACRRARNSGAALSDPDGGFAVWACVDAWTTRVTILLSPCPRDYRQMMEGLTVRNNYW